MVNLIAFAITTTQVGDLKKGINPLSISQLTFTDKHVNTAMKAGFLSGILALAVRTCLLSCISQSLRLAWDFVCLLPAMALRKGF